MTTQREFHLQLEQSAPAVSESLINTVTEDFPGKKEFIQFYLEHNGGYPPSPDAHLYRDRVYNLSTDDYNAMHVEGFYFIPHYPDEKFNILMSITRVRKMHATYSEAAKNFSRTHIPFAFDASGNEYWIDINIGRVVYINLERENEIIDNIAPSFSDFIENIEPTLRKSK
ncbi:SMI1/KNR4 family protein [Citrobacter werkmanii]|uniref:SMI1/KNR4 family protein n=1 Tax=Citrobacter werkmanii TaxID=67827 RepID=UPI002887EF61|nr:SMI1/KNR4 family protein [Citrobacter werkmanii]MDT0638171.1 SMI1/KNR4 family protein [Citrobacter werkmanii]HCR3448885.1 SMI1/KNR4 family protein [Citrobacter werkmanii]